LLCHVPQELAYQTLSIMSKFEKDNWSWQSGQLQQRFSEWLEAKLKFGNNNQSLAPWLISSISYFLWFLLIAGILWVAYRIIQSYWPQLARQRFITTPAPVTVKTYTLAELLAQAQRWQQEGNYSEACRCLYLAMLQRFNDAKVIPHLMSRTDREYANLLRNSPLTNSGTVLLQTHEQMQFADRPVSAESLEQCQQAYQQIDRQLLNQARPNS
jgi:Domain of unknown function (DUF4129)